MADLKALGKGEAVGRSLDGLLDSGRDTLELCAQARSASALARLAA
ncbi:hypothetical protein ACFQ9Z_38255 [Streptomyces sp. NPDC056580]